MENLYQSCDFYMLRTPILPVEFYKSICFSNDVDLKVELKKILETKEIREAIQIGSINLFNNLDRINNKVSSSVIKYLIRMSTRTTPYGLFSGVDIGHFDAYSNIQLDEIKSFKKRMRPDMGWLYGVINSIEHNRMIFKSIKVKNNELVYQKGDRLENPYVSNVGMINQKSGDLTASIRLSDVLQIVMKNTQKFIGSEDLVNIISSKYPHVNENKIYNYLEELVRYDYLITNLRPPLTDINPFEYVIKQVKEIEGSDDLYNQLLIISTKINKYNTQTIGESISLLFDIKKEMKEIYENENYLQVDTRIFTNQNTLNKCVGRDMEKYCNMLQRLGVSGWENNSIKAYKEEFIEKYGMDIEVQLLELLDEDIGLGAPAGYLNPISYKNYVPEIPNAEVKKITEFIEHRIIEANAIQNEIIKLTDEDISEMVGDSDIPKEEEFAPSVEFNIIVSAQSCEEIDKGNYLLFIGPNFGSNKAGKSFGRFLDILDEDEAQWIKAEIYNKEKESINDEYIMVELSECLQHGRGNNVTINSNNVEYELCIATNPINTKEKIDITDLYVGISGDKFYVKSRSLNKKLYITSHHMMTPMNGSNIGRFLKDITFGYHLNLLDIALMFQIGKFDHVPRIMYDNIVLIPSSWKIKKEKLNLSSYEEFELSFASWREKNKIPRYVYQKENDNRLLFDLCSHTHIKELFHIIKKHNDDVLLTETEMNQDINNLIVKDKNSQRYCCELTIPLIRKSVTSEEDKVENHVIESIQTESDISLNRSKFSIQEKSRDLLPGNEGWYYYKLYTPKIRMEELIGDYLSDFCEMLVERKLIFKYFFLRYADPKVHIRLRVQVIGENDFLVQTYLKEFIKNLNNKGLVNTLQIENYVRELERYGGAEVIQSAEDYFYADSMYVGQLIKLIREKKIEYEDEKVAIISIISIMEQFNVTFEDQEKLFSKIINRNEYRDQYRKHRKEYMQFANWEAFCNKQLVEGNLYELIRKKQEKTLMYRQSVDNLDQRGMLCNSKQSILLSIIHMFCNRFKGDTEWERLIMALVAHSLYDLKAFKNSVQKKKTVVGSHG